MYGPNSTFNYGSQGLFALGPCNISVTPYYNYPPSKTHTKLKPTSAVYSYGGNGKFVPVYATVNDTLSFGSSIPALPNRRVAISNFTISKQPANARCASKDKQEYDKSILGLSRFRNPSLPTAGPSYRQDLLDTGLVESSTMSMWFDKATGPVTDVFRGTVLFGAVPEGKYTGKLTRVKLSPPDGAYVGYYVPAPTISVTGVKGKTNGVAVSKNSKQCLIDSGTGNDMLAIDQDTFLKTAGLVLYGGYPAYDGPCKKIPKDAAIKFTFPGLNKDKKGKAQTVSISVPLRNYARGNTDYLGNKNKCGLSMDLSTSNDCVLGAPSNTAMFLAVSDEKNQFALAQGLVSSGATAGISGLGDIKTIKKGQDLPAV